MDFRGFILSMEILIGGVIRRSILPVEAEDFRDPRHDQVEVDEGAKAEGQEVKRPRKRGSGAN